MNLPKDLPELITAEVISAETAEKIRDYYKNKRVEPTNRLFIVFGVLGAILTGLGLILIIAHNWDDISRGAKTLIAFLPLLAAQVLCAYTLLRNSGSVAWREASSAFLFFAVGASISLVSQIYNIPGDLASFMLWWMLLCLPLIYLMRSSVTSLLYIAGITYYACYLGYFKYNGEDPFIYWLLLIAALPHYYDLFRNRPHGNSMVFHNWFIPLSLVITLGTIARHADELMFVAYVSLFGLYYILGTSDFFSGQKIMKNGFRALGSLGTIFLLLMLSFNWFWEDLIRKKFPLGEVMVSPEIYVTALLSVASGYFLYFQVKGRSFSDVKPLAVVFPFFIATFLIGLFSPGAVVLINVLVFLVGVLTIRDGARRDHLGILNLGLLVITALVICRFFDTDLSFVVRGLLFVGVGAGFFLTNYMTLKKRRTSE